MDALWRMAWALPLVLCIGFAVTWALKRILRVETVAPTEDRRTRLVESLSLSDDTRIHVIEVDRQMYLLVESALQTALHAGTEQAGATAASHSRAGAAWAQRLMTGSSR